MTFTAAPQDPRHISADAAPEASIPPYPREPIPKDPVFSLATFKRFSSSSPPPPCVLDAGAVRFVNRGCMAIGLALQHAQVGDGDEVLLPAYHCISMIEPVIWRAANPVFYRINADTSVNLTDIEARITARTRALLVPHYFGFPQDMVRIRAFCDAHQLLLIEDCAHAFFGAVDQAPLGSFGDYAIASTWKFFPSPEGGILVSARKDLGDIKLQQPNLRFQMKTVINTLEHALEYRRLPIFGLLIKVPLLLKDWALSALRMQPPDKSDAVSADISAPGEVNINTVPGPINWGFDPALINQQMSLFSRWVAARASKQRIVEKRRAHYAKLLTKFRQLPGCRPLFPILPAGVVPHVFPLLIDNPEPVFIALKRQGVPIIRFGEYLWPAMPKTLCAVSTDLSRRVFQLPCHQDLLPQELEWMIECVRATLQRMPAARP